MGGSGPPVCAGGDAPVHSTAGLVTFHSRANEVRIAFRVGNDRSKSAVLARSDITIRSENQAVTAITSFDRADDLPLQLALVVDASGSMQEIFPEERLAAEKFLKQLVRPQVDEAFVVGFATGALVTHSAALEDIRPDGQTALYDTLYEVARTLQGTPRPESARRAIILLSDGEDNWSRRTLEEAIAAAQQADAVIYGITAHSRRYEFRGDGVLQELAGATGGRAFVLKHFDRLDKVLDVIEAELRSYYVVGFRPPSLACGFHPVKISVRGRSKVRARGGYYVKKP